MTVKQAINGSIEDSNWIAEAFFTPTGAGGAGVQIQPFSSALMELYDTTPGGNRSINPKLQYCRYSDPRQPSLAASSKGMGTYYTNAHDTKATRVSLRFGVPKFNPLSRFLNNYYDPSLAELTNTGHVTSSIFSTYTVGKALGTICTLPLQVYFGITYLYNRVDAAITGRPYSKFFYLEPTMALYWSGVTTLVNKLSVDLGIVHGYDSTNLTGEVGTARPSTGLSSTEIGYLNKILPDIFRADSESLIDVKAMSSRAQRLQNQYYTVVSEISKSASDYDDFVSQVQAQLTQGSITDPSSSIEDFTDYLDTYSATPNASATTDTENITPQTDAETDSSNDTTSTSETTASRSTIFSEDDEPGLKSLLAAELLDGSAFVTFDVDYNGAISESFSNSTKDSGLAETLNGISKKHRDTWINFANGDLGDGPIAGMLEATAGAVKGLLTGAAASIGFSGLSQIAGGGFADIQEVWDDATANLPVENYTMRLENPNGDKISFLINIGIPLCCILEGGLPRSTGKSSYTSPFICSLESHGRNRISRGIIDSISISRGASNVGFNDQGLPTAVDISFSVKNLDKIMHVPVTDSLISTVTSFSEFDEDSALSDYISSLAAVSLYDRFYAGPRLRMAWANLEADWDSLTSASTFAQFATSSAPGQILSALLRASPNLQGL